MREPRGHVAQSATTNLCRAEVPVSLEMAPFLSQTLKRSVSHPRTTYMNIETQTISVSHSVESIHL